MNSTIADRSDFATRLYDRLARTLTGANLFVSPFSLQVALAMCAVGARGATRRALAELIGAPESMDEQNRQFAERLRLMSGIGDEAVRLTTANALWGQQGFHYDTAFQRAIVDFYDGVFQEVDFRGASDQAAKKINAWVEGKTHGKILELIGRDLIAADTRLILTNAIHFKGKWDREFNKSDTWDEDWRGAGGLRKVPMMQQRGNFPYCECDDFQALELPYQGGRLSMRIVLPRKLDGLADLEVQWAGANLDRKVTDALSLEAGVTVSLPRFAMATELMLKPVLSAMGAELPFSDGADFSGISAEPIKITEVIHKAFIEVNEEGTEAAAATGIAMAKCASATKQAKFFLADHPFFFFIRDVRTDTVLFCGRVSDPS